MRAAFVGHMGQANPHNWSGFGWQVLLLTPPALLYFLVRDLSAGQVTEAHANAAAIVDVERSLGLDWEATLQQRVLDTDWIIAAVNWIYIWGHFPVIVMALFLLFRLSRKEFVTLRNAMVASGVVGLICFALYPVAPPRLFDPTTYFDSLNELSSSYKVLQNPKLTNQFAAVPSFHVGWNLLVAIAVWRATRFRPLRLLAIASPILMSMAVLLTANHWLLDIVAGLAVALFGVAVASLMDRGFGRVRAEPLPVAEAQADSGAGGAGGARTHDRAIMSRAL